MEIEIVQNIESVIPVFEIKKSIPIPFSSKNSSIAPNEETTQTKNAKGVGGGFSDSETNRVVEEKAISYITEQYRNEGWVVVDKQSDKCGYDLLCSKANRCEHVEVKGIKGEDVSFVITNNEIKCAQTDQDFVLYAVTSALSNPNPHKILKKELFEEYNIKAISYSVSLKR